MFLRWSALILCSSRENNQAIVVSNVNASTVTTPQVTAPSVQPANNPPPPPPPLSVRSATSPIVAPPPRPQDDPCLADNDSPLPKYKRDLVQKMKVLRQELHALQPPTGHCRIEVSREEIFEVTMLILVHCSSCITFPAHTIILMESNFITGMLFMDVHRGTFSSLVNYQIILLFETECQERLSKE